MRWTKLRATGNAYKDGAGVVDPRSHIIGGLGNEQ